MHSTPWPQSVDAAEVVAVSTNAQRSSSQQGNILFRARRKEMEKKSLVVEAVAVNFLAVYRFAGTVGAPDVRSFPPISTPKRASTAFMTFVRLSPEAKNE
jgi:hypothetical protein